MKSTTPAPKKVHLGWKIWSVLFTLLIILGLGYMVRTEGFNFEFYRNFISGAVGSFALFFYAFDHQGIPAKAWKVVLVYCALDAFYDLFFLLNTEGVLATVLGYPFELAILFPMFLALYRLSGSASNRD